MPLTRRREENGTTIIEFVLITTLILVPLLLGAMVVGLNLVRAIQVSEVSRDSGHMFARGVDFSTSTNGLANRAVLTYLAPRLASASGTGVVMLSAIQYVGDKTCNKCANLYHGVITRQLVIGNPSLFSSHFGTVPAASMVKDKNGNLDGTGSVIDPYNDLKVRTDVILSVIPVVNGVAMNDGDIAYVAETYFTSTDFDIQGFLKPSALYSRAIF